MHRVNVSLLCLLSLSLAGSVFGQTANDPPPEPSGIGSDLTSQPAETSADQSPQSNGTSADQSPPSTGTPAIQSPQPAGNTTIQNPLPPGYTSLNSLSGGVVAGPGTYMNARYMSGNGVGYQNGYFQLGGFVPIWMNENTFIAPDLRVMATNNSQAGGNLGAVFRTYLPGRDRIVGGYGYLDLDQSLSNHNYTQATVGVETLGQFWDFRVNGYIPTSRQDNYVSTGAGICIANTPTFAGNNIVFNGVQAQTREQAATGVDFEFGAPLFASTPWLRGYAGAYFYSTSQMQSPPITMGSIPNQATQNPIGFRGRIDAWVSDDLLIGANVTTDPVWGTNVNAVVDFRFSGFKPTRYFPQFTTRQRMLAPVQRNWRVAVERYGTGATVPIDVINPATGKPYFVDFVNNAAPAGGDGTFEHPFNYFNFPNGLPQADIIVVERGNSTYANPYDGTIKLFNNQLLLGEGAANVAPIQMSAAYGGCSVNGLFSLPFIDGSGNQPFVTNGTITPIVTLANNNEVAGFNFINATGPAISGTNISNFNLHDNEITGNAGGGIILTNVSGTSTVISNINQGVTDYNPGPLAGNNAAGGLYVSSGPGGLSNLLLTNVNFSSSPLPPAANPLQELFGISLNATNGPLTTVLTNIVANGNVNGIVLNATNGQTLTATDPGITADSNSNDGLLITASTGGAVNVNFTAGQFNDNLVNGIQSLIDGAGSTSTQTFTNTFITNSTGKAPQQVGYQFAVTNNGLLTANFNQDAFSTGSGQANAQNAINGSATGTGTGTASSATAVITMNETNASGSGSNNVLLNASKGGLLEFSAQNGSLSNSVAGSGLLVNVNGANSAAFINLTNMTVNGNKLSGFTSNIIETVAPGAGQTGASLFADLEGSTFSNNTLQGLTFNATGPGATAYVGLGTYVVGNQTLGTADTVDGNLQGGVLGLASAQGTINFREGSPVGNGTNVTHIDNNGTPGGPTPYDGAFFGGDNGTIRVLFYGGTTNGNTGDGLGFGPIAPNTSTNGSTFTISLANGFTSSNNGGYGLNVQANGANSADLIQDPTTAPPVFSGNTLGAENLVLSNTNQILLQEFGSFNNSSGNGVNLVFTNVTTAIVSIDGEGDSTINNNQGDGISVVMNGVQNAAVTISGYTSISNNGLALGAGGLGQDGVYISLNGTSPASPMNAAIQIQGVTGDTTMSMNRGDAVDIQLNNANLVNPFGNLPGVNLAFVTINSNQPQDLSAPLPSVNGGNGIVPTDALVLDSLNVMHSGGNAGTGGIVINGVNSSLGIDPTVAANDAYITNNTVNSSTNGSGIAITMLNTVAPTVPSLDGLNINNNYVGAVNANFNYLVTPTASANLGDGIQVDLVNNVGPANGPLFSTADGVQISNNVVQGNSSNGIEFMVSNPVGSTSTANNVVISGNTVSGNGGNGLNILLSGVQMTNLTTNGNSIDDNTQNGINMELVNASISGWTFTGGDITGNTMNGLMISNSSTSSITGAMFTNVTIKSNGLDGIQETETDTTATGFGTALNPITFLDDTISNNGTLGIGNGIDFTTLSAGSSVDLVFTDDVINSNATNGVTGTITGAGSQGTVTMNGITIVSNGGSGTLLGANNGASLNVTIQQDTAGTGSTISDNGGTGVWITGSGPSAVNVSLLNSSILDNGKSGVGSTDGLSGLSLELTNFATTNLATLTVTDSTIGNTAAGGSQVDGIYFELQQTGAVPLQNPLLDPNVPPPPNLSVQDGLIMTLANTVLTNNRGSGLEGTVSGPAGGVNLTTGAFITYNTLTVNNNGGNGVAFNVSNGGLVSFGPPNPNVANNLTTFSNNGQNGVFINATDANTLVALLFEDTAVNSNGSAVFPGDGVNATALNGAHINIGADTTGLAPVTFSNNAGDGINLLVSGVNSMSDLDIHNAFIGADAQANLLGNGLNGLEFQSNDGGTVLVRAYDTHFDGNITGSGLLGSVNDTNGASTTGIVSIIGGSANSNGADGYSLTATNSSIPLTGISTLTGEFQADDNGNGVSAQFNGGVGLNFAASGGGIDGNLLMTGDSNLSNNGGGTVTVNMSGANNAIVALSGIFDNSQGDGIDVNLSNITGLALVSIQGPGQVANNAGNGIDVTLTNVYQGGVFIGGLDGGVINNGTANGAGGLGQDGIRVTMDNVGSQPGGLGALMINGQNGTSIQAPSLMNVSGNSGNGVNVTVDGGSILNNAVFSTVLTTPPPLMSTQVTVINNLGADLPLVREEPGNAYYPPIPDPLLATSVQDVSSILGLTYLQGSTLQSLFGQNVAVQNLTLDNNGNGTGPNSITNGNGILFNVGTLAAPGGEIDGTPMITNDYITNTGITSATGTHDGIQVNLMYGAIVNSFDITNNFIGVTGAPPTGIAAGNNGNGINFIAGGTDVPTNTAATLALLNISNNYIENNTGIPGVTGNGIDLQFKNAPSLGVVNIDSDQILNNKGDGVQMIDPNTGSTNLTVNFTNDNISFNGTVQLPSAYVNTTYPPGAMGIDIVLDNINATPPTTTINILSSGTGATAENNIISNNASYGLFLEATQQAIYNLNITGTYVGGVETGPQNVFNGNTDAGIAIVAGSFTYPDPALDPTRFSVGSIVIDDVLVENTLLGSHPGLPNYPFLGDGIGILTQQYAEIANLVIGNPTVRNTDIVSNAGDGIRIKAIENSEFRQTTKNALGQDVTVVTQLGSATMQLQNLNVSNNGLNGIEISRLDSALLSWDDPTLNPEAALFLSVNNPNYYLSWQAITGGVDDPYTINASGNYVYSNVNNVTAANPLGLDGSFIHLNDVIANGNGQNGLYVNTTNQQFPITRIDIVDDLQVGGIPTTTGLSQFGNDVNGVSTGNGENGMLFQTYADSTLLVNSQNTIASGNGYDGILVQTFNSSTFGDVFTSFPEGDPTSPGAIPSTFSGMTLSLNGTAATYAEGGGNGFEVQANTGAVGQPGTDTGPFGTAGTDPNFPTSSNSIVAITFVAAPSSPTNLKGRNLFDSNAGDGFKFTANNYSTNFVSLSAVDMRDTQFIQDGGSGIHFTTNNESTSTLYVGSETDPTTGLAIANTGVSIGYPTASSTQTGLSGNGIWIATYDNSAMTMLLGNQNIPINPGGTPPTPDPLNAPDVSIYGNKGDGILITNTDSSTFYGSSYDIASRYNSDRGYTALMSSPNWVDPYLINTFSNAHLVHVSSINIIQTSPPVTATTMPADLITHTATLSVNAINYSNFSDNGKEGIAIISNAENQSDIGLLVLTVPSTVFPGYYDEYHYLNLYPDTSGVLSLTNSTVSNNGNPTPYSQTISNVNGLEIDVSTYSSISADIRDNIFHGNTLADVATASFQASYNGGGFNGIAAMSGGAVPTTTAKDLSGFLADGTINPNGRLNTPTSLNDSPSGFDTIFLEDTALLDMRFIGNVGDALALSQGESNNPNMNADGAVGTDQSTAKFNSGPGRGQSTAIFQVDAYNYDVVSSTGPTNGSGDVNTFSGTNILPLDGFPTGTGSSDPFNFPGAIFVQNSGIPLAAQVRQLELGIVNQDGYYTNANANPSNTVNPTAFTQVRVDDITANAYGTTANGVIGYTGATGTFTLGGTGLPIAVGDLFRVHLLDTNTFNQAGVTTNVEQAFLTGFTNPGIQIQEGQSPTFTYTEGPQAGTTQGSIRVPPGETFFLAPGQTFPSPLPGFYYVVNPLAPYFDFPSISFPPY